MLLEMSPKKGTFMGKPRAKDHPPHNSNTHIPSYTFLISRGRPRITSFRACCFSFPHSHSRKMHYSFLEQFMVTGGLLGNCAPLPVGIKRLIKTTNHCHISSPPRVDHDPSIPANHRMTACATVEDNEHPAPHSDASSLAWRASTCTSTFNERARPR